MFKTIPTTLFQYCVPSFEDVVLVLKDFRNYYSSKIELQDTENSLWKLIDTILEFTQVIDDNEPSLTSLEKTLISRISITMMDDLTTTFLRLEEESQNGVQSVSNNQSPIESSFPDLSIFELDKEISYRWQQYFESLKGNQQEGELVRKAFVEMGNVLILLKEQLETLIYLLGISRSEYKDVSKEEFEGLLNNGGIERNFFPLVLTLKQSCVDAELETEFIPVVVKILAESTFFDQTEYSWNEMIFYTLVLHVAFLRFAYLSRESQSFLLNRYFFRSLIVGVPIRTCVSHALYETNNFVVYLNTCELFVINLKENQEKIPDQTKIFGQFVEELSRIYENTPDVQKEIEGIKLFVDQIYDVDVLTFKRWLHEALDIFVHTKNANLIEQNKGGELSPKDEADNDLILLMAYFGIVEDGMEKIISYFKQEKPRVSLPLFLDTLKKTVDLTEELSIEACVLLQDNLQKRGMIKNDLIVFDESQGKFAWV